MFFHACLHGNALSDTHSAEFSLDQDAKQHLRCWQACAGVLAGGQNHGLAAFSRQAKCSPLKGLAGAVGAGLGALVGVFGFRLHCLRTSMTQVLALRSPPGGLRGAARRWWAAQLRINAAAARCELGHNCQPHASNSTALLGVSDQILASWQRRARRHRDAPPPVVDPGANVVGQAGNIGPGGVLAVGALAAAALAAALGVRVHCAAQSRCDGAAQNVVDGARCRDKGGRKSGTVCTSPRRSQSTPDWMTGSSPRQACLQQQCT